MAVGSLNAASVYMSDLMPLQNEPLKHFTFGDGSEIWIRFFCPVQVITGSVTVSRFFVSDCEWSFDIFKRMLLDLNCIHVKKVRLIKLFSDHFAISGDPFDILPQLQFRSNETIVETWINSSVMVQKFIQNVWKSPAEEAVLRNITYKVDYPYGFQFSLVLKCLAFIVTMLIPAISMFPGCS